MTRSHNPPVYRFDIDHGVNDAPPSPRRQRNAQELTPGYLWNSTTQELIPILPKIIPTTDKIRRSSPKQSAAGT